MKHLAKTLAVGAAATAAVFGVLSLVAAYPITIMIAGAILVSYVFGCMIMDYLE